MLILRFCKGWKTMPSFMNCAWLVNDNGYYTY